MKVHLRSIRLRNNAGMDFPECHSNAKLLDLNKARLATTGELEKVTCKRCIKEYWTVH